MVDERIESGTKARTRRAILDAAVAVLSKDTSASLADIATAAGVGRTTVHRYFPERSHLLTAINTDAWERIAEATQRARLHDGDAVAALDRLCQAYFDLGDVLMLIFNEPSFAAGIDWNEETKDDIALRQVVERGHRDGTIDPDMPPRWIVHALWTLLYAAWQHAQLDDVPRHDALTTCLRSLRKLLAP
ncbi:MAG: TetR/AcrR family transcriptional regulator [Actinomycetota bacterium]|nr:TetR/AcrR family transcriptional regulator [Actinomycetota bacterium]